jgi:4-hydroxy-tetrahydrodipicolinate synthase
MSLAFPRENQYFWERAIAGDYETARRLYAWYTPLLHLDTPIKFVQYIKLAIQEAGLGSEWVRAPRLPLVGAERERILGVIHRGLKTRPEIPAQKRKE